MTTTPKLTVLAVTVASSMLWASAGFAQEIKWPEPTYGGYLMPSLNTGEYRWTLNHICVPSELPVTHNASNRTFTQAIVGFIRLRWELGMQAAASGDAKGADFFRGYIAHTIIDLYWPDRVLRDENGAITAFRPCADFGGGRGIASLEQHPSEDVKARMSGRSRESAVLAAVQKLYTDGRPFDEAETTIRAGLLQFAPGRENALLLRR